MRKTFSIDLARRVKIVIPLLEDCIVIYERFQWHILCFDLNTVENNAVLERGFSKRLETKITFAPSVAVLFRKKKEMETKKIGGRTSKTI